jgi:aminopeptidase YwaD
VRTLGVMAIVVATATVAACAQHRPTPHAPPVTPSRGAAGTSGTEHLVSLERRIDAHLRFLASDALHGRGSGTRDEWIAATYIGAQLAMLGLEPMGDHGWFVQRVDVQRFTAASPPLLTVGDRTFTRGEHFLVRTVPAARVSGALHHHASGTPVPDGAAVVVPADTPAAALADMGRAALLLRRASAAQARAWAEASRDAPAWIASQVVGVPAPSPSGPTLVTLEAAAFDAIAALPGGTRVDLRTELAPAEQTRTWNALARLRGAEATAASETVVLSAHLDHIGVSGNSQDALADTINNGADDDASGVVAVLELARALSAGPRPRRSIVFALFGSEEAGGFGARYFVERPVVPLSDIVADLQVEMIGRPDPKVPAGTLWLTGYERSTLGPQLAARGARLVQDPHPDQRFFERSDNIRFARRGVVAHTISSFGLHAEYHRPSDEVAHINLAHMREAIVSLVEPVRWLATTTETPAWVEGKRP